MPRTLPPGAGLPSEALTLRPPDLPNPPVYNKVNPADTPILTLALSSTTPPTTDIST